ncbi:glycosyl hydrolases family 38 N-terminal domain-containing protein [Boeremia exigua]|uniref:glycosyl hydrolases family 38 N-terminal domain-containing protein n=1 Tax=Boeremia exigua TaxID=749465 RepID=UPI001E8E0E69|nr:glycosyl hydrolases family 38 N-terminal domain-containing protein [Boeremia exigua]KAH6638439.1 glycosyl hydrolases family 38 N-terminal domain-containing protein [Boeremia exigua]
MGGESHTRTVPMASHPYPQLAAGPVGKQIHSIYSSRLRQFTDGGQYREQGLRGKLDEARVKGTDTDHVKLAVYSPPGQSRPLFKEATSHGFTPTHLGASFGPSWSTHWFKIQLTVPKALLEKERLEFHWDADNEGLIWTEDGHTVHGLTGGGERVEWILPDSFRDGKPHTFYIEMACNGMFGNAPGGDSIQPPAPDRYYTLHTADIVAVNLEARALYFDFWEIGDASREFPQDSLEAHGAQQVANRIMDAFIAGGGSNASIKEGRKIAREYLGDVDSHKVYDGDEALVTGIGYCHIDTCWLWPFAETKRKVNRSWSSQCDLIDRYPELRFCCSQAQQYKWLEQDYPSTFDRVKKKVKEGSFQPIGGSWVEHDTNLPGGESLIRQFLYGQRYFESRFGKRCKTFWLPDTFGYSTQLPQICRISGMTRFLTQKLSWNNINNFPHTTFNWVALDNSQVICHMPPSETYTAEANFGDVKRSITQHKSLDQDQTSLLVFGKGDGGGGPTWQHLEKLRRCRGISEKTSLLPRIKLGDSADDFFDKLEKKIENGTELVTWYGELYFELHRGTYTTQANNKRNNRKSEIMLRDIEYLATLATVRNGFGKSSAYKYPKKDIDDMWENVLLCQFHDCLPGSSIEMCYDDSDKIYAKVFATGEKLLSEALSELGFDDEKSLSPGSELCTINTLPWTRTEIVKLPDSHPVEYGLAHGDALSTMAIRPLASAYSAATATIAETGPGVFELRNSQYAVKVTDGAITSLYDLKVKRELIPKGKKAAQLVIYDDKPLYWQAWDVEVYHLNSRQELSPHKVSISSSSPSKVSLTIETKISDKSWVTTTLSLPAAVGNSPSAIEISAEIEWHETMKFLKVEFPVDITNTSAAYETQFGIVHRPTHYNTTWDMAKFEVCVHKWADLSEATYGVSILNDSKFGFAVAGNVMRLSLLRAPKAPDAHADMGRHFTKYAIFPHAGPLDHATVRKAAEFNNPLRVVARRTQSATEHPPIPSFRVRGADNLVLDTIKRGEDDPDVSRGELPPSKSHSVILRVYDALGGKSRGMLEWSGVRVRKVVRVNALEDEEGVVEGLVRGGGGEGGEGSGSGSGSGSVGIEVRAFEVATFKLVLED